MQQATTAANPSFEDIYQEYHGALTRYTLSRLRGISEEDAADIVADVWVKIWQALPEWQYCGVPIGSWLFQIMRNAIIDRIRVSGWKKTISLDIDAHDPIDEASESEVLGVLSDEVMQAVVASLDPRHAHLIELVYLKGWRLSEVAQEYGITLDAAKKMHRRALGRVRTFLETGATRRRRGTASA